MTIDYRTRGVCSTRMVIDVEDDTVKSVKIFNGCDGNLQGISRLVEGMKVTDAISKLEGIRCGGKSTSCPDQLAQALKQAVKA
ncbi:TIGR03905 family TSCPD domain-containing protein [uncultured Pseudoflavonifractor sp.]|uniref:TIGR03905 family TSCPD domain-containing protein n=1 Tax=uncultured Pseudoflavonifractor sp. TaxID=1221379 RepID=UPI0025D27344|nr:TIGR03905 family TSCPD domain-containing protein [uncultured Pseudoflavonifractor sp.]